MSELPLIGAYDPPTASPGDAMRCRISSDHADGTAHPVRLIHGDPRPRGPGVRTEPVPLVPPRRFTGRRQALHGGSHVMIPDLPVLEEMGGLTVRMGSWPTTPDTGQQGLLGHRDDDGGRGDGVGLAADGSLAVRIGRRPGRGELSTGVPLRAQERAIVAVTHDAANGGGGAASGGAARPSPSAGAGRCLMANRTTRSPA